MTRMPGALAAHAAREATTLCQCWKVTRRDGTVLGFTDTDAMLRFDSVDFAPESGFSASEARETAGLEAGSADIEGVLNSPAIVAEEVEAGAFDGAKVETFLVNWAKPEERMLLRTGVIGRITLAGGRFTAEVDSLMASLDRPRPRYFRRFCPAELGDGDCRKDVSAAPFTLQGQVTSVPGEARCMVSGIEDRPAGWFAGGTMVLPGGETSRIVAHALEDGVAALVLETGAATPQPGDAVTLVAGCDKSFAACRDKFANALNFRGFPHMPGNDAGYGYVNGATPLDGGPVTP